MGFVLRITIQIDMNQTLTIGVGALLAGGAVGFILGNAGGDEAEATADRLTRETGQAKIQRMGAPSSDNATARTNRSKPRDLDDAMGEPGQVARVQALIDLYSDMDPGQLELEAAKLGRLPFAEQMLASNLLFSRWGEIDPLGALEFSSSIGGFGGNFARPTVLRSWASMDPVNAAQYYMENQGEFGGRGPGGGGADMVAAEWAKLDPNAALEWAKTLDGRERNQALESVVGEMARKDPAGAAALASTIDPESRGDAFAEVAEQWAATDFDSAEAWIRSLPSDEQGEAMASAIETLASSDPVQAADKALAMGSGDHRDEAVREVAEAWSREDPATAADWLVQQNPENSGGAMREVMQNWSNQDSEGALTFINGQPLGEMRDSATQAYLWTNRDTAPQSAVSLAEAITDDRDRNRTIMMTAGRWMQEDETAARSYIQQSTALSDRAKDRLLNGGGQGGPGRGQGGGQGGWRGRGR